MEKIVMHGVNREIVKKRLKEWGLWLRSARTPGQHYTLSRFNLPLAKKRIVTPIYRDENAENLDLIMSFHMDKQAIEVLEVYYVNQAPISSAAAHFNCSIRSFTYKRHEAECTLMGILSVINMQKIRKSA